MDNIKKELEIIIDTRTHEIQQRSIREGNAMLMQFRTVIYNIDGTEEVTEWETTAITNNYGGCFDEAVQDSSNIVLVMLIFIVSLVLGLIVL